MSSTSDYFRYLRNRTQELIPDDLFETHELVVRVGNISMPTEYVLTGIRHTKDVAITLHGISEDGNQVQTQIHPASLLLHMEARKRKGDSPPAQKIGFQTADSQDCPSE